MNRRDFVACLGASSFFLQRDASGFREAEKTHLVTISFDDGFEKSFLEAAALHEKYGLSGCFNVLASAHLPEFVPPDDYILPELIGDFATWNELKARGHEVMVHGWAHHNLGRLPLEEAKEHVDRALAYFEQHLDGFKREEAIFNFPFNSSTPELEEYVLTQVRALRTAGGWDVNPFPTPGTRKIGCVIYPRPDNGDSWMKDQIDQFLESNGGWLVLNTHGLGEEGWGPISADYLDKALGRLTKLEHVSVLNVTQVLDLYG